MGTSELQKGKNQSAGVVSPNDVVSPNAVNSKRGETTAHRARTNAALAENLRELIKEAKAAVNVVHSKAPHRSMMRKDKNDIDNLNALIQDANSVIEVLEDSASPSANEGVRALINDATSVITQVMSDVSLSPSTADLEMRKFSFCKSVSFADDVSEVRLYTPGEAVVPIMEDEERDAGDEERALVPEVKDDRTFFALASDLAEEIGGMLVDDSARLASNAAFANCMWDQNAKGVAVKGRLVCSPPEGGDSDILLQSEKMTLRQHAGGCIVSY